MQQVNHPIILFDGVCYLCNDIVNFLIRRDKKKHFRFATLQSDIGQYLLEKHHLPSTNLDTFVLIQDEQCYTQSSAALRVLWKLGGLWRLSYAFIIIPPFLRNYIYQLVAKNRYRLFGKRDECMVPNQDLKDRFYK
jgi:predicted DCC family thiol-disulfide oxidoreductase YuxK